MARASRAEKLARLKQQLSQAYLARDQYSAHDAAALRSTLQQLDWLLVAVLGERMRCQKQLDAVVLPQLSASALAARLNHMLEQAEKLALQLEVDPHLVEQVYRVVEASAINESLTRNFKLTSARASNNSRWNTLPADLPDVLDALDDGTSDAP